MEWNPSKVRLERHKLQQHSKRSREAAGGALIHKGLNASVVINKGVFSVRLARNSLFHQVVSPPLQGWFSLWFEFGHINSSQWDRLYSRTTETRCFVFFCTCNQIEIKNKKQTNSEVDGWLKGKQNLPPKYQRITKEQVPEEIKKWGGFVQWYTLHKIKPT